MSHSLRFVSWAAVSSLPQTKKVSLEDQLSTNREHVQRHSGRLVEELVVPGESRSIVLFEDACRRIDAYARLRELIQARKFDVLIYLDRSRLGRKASLSMAVVELCHEAGIIAYETENPPATLTATNGTSHDDMLIGAIKSVGAQNEIEKLVERNKVGMLGRIRAGNFAYRAPWGWLERYDAQGKLSHLVDPVAQRVMDFIFEQYVVKGRGVQAIVDELNRQNIPSPGGTRWYKSSIHFLFKRIWRFAGYAEINRDSKRGRPYLKAKGNWPTLLTEEQAREIEVEGQQRRSSRRSVGTTHRFSQCVWCEVCNRNMVAEYSSTSYGDKRYERERYRCRNKHPLRQVEAHRVQDAVEAAVVYLLEQDELSAVLPTVVDRREAIQNEITDLTQQVEEQNAALLRADDAYVAGTMSKDRYDRQAARIASSIEAIERRIAACNHALEEETDRNRHIDRLHEVVEMGKSMLKLEDIPTANAWFRRHLRVWIRASKVARVEYL